MLRTAVLVEESMLAKAQWTKKTCCCPRFLSNGSSGSINIFDRRVKRLQRNRAASGDNPELYDYLKDEVASHVVDRVCDIARQGSCYSVKLRIP